MSFLYDEAQDVVAFLKHGFLMSKRKGSDTKQKKKKTFSVSYCAKCLITLP